MIKSFGIIFLMLIYSLSVSGADSTSTVHIRGNAPGYAGEEIIFFAYTDHITRTEEELFRFRVDQNDEFSVVFETGNEIKYIFSHTGINYIYLYIEPGAKYTVMLPGKTEKSPWERLNPYFEGIPTHIAVLNNDDSCLNTLISRFDNMYEPLFGETLITLTVNRDQQLFDSIINEFERVFSTSTNQYFNDYKRYKLALFGIISQQQSAKLLSDNYFVDDPVLYGNVAYMELFNQVYNKYFLFFSRTASGSRIFDDINRKRSLGSLKNTLQTDPVLGGGQLLEMVMLKGLHDSFYGSDFSRSSLLVVLDSLAATTAYSEHAIIAGHIREKVTRLLTGFKPPAFELMNSGGELVSLAAYRGYYVYLNFCTAASYSCLSEFDLLSRMIVNHTPYLKLVTVFIDDSYDSMLDFLARYDYDWDFLFYGNQPSILKEYDIRMFPGYYLIDRDGTLLMSPAPSPGENFEIHLLRTMRSRGEVR
jgi:hypothetical protein